MMLARPILPRRIVRWRFAPAIVIVSALALVLTGLVIGVHNDRAYRSQQIRETEVQAHILAASVSAALAFQDAAAAREYVAALNANPEVRTAGVYDARGALVAGYGRAGAAPPARGVLRPPLIVGDAVEVTAPVMEGGSNLGLVLLSTGLDPPARRLARYGGVALLVVMALLVVAVLGIAQGNLARANAELKARAAELAAANEELLVQIAEREKAEAALRQSQRMEALGRLTGGVAHDFNNILMVASSGLDLMERAKDPARRELIRAGIRQAVERGANLTRQLLTFSRRSALKPEVVDLATQLEGMQVLLEGSLREDIALSVDVPQGLWPVEVDASELELAILNLAVNARDAMSGGGALRIQAANLPGEGDAGDMVRLSVTDTGRGIAADQIGMVFEPFFTTKEVGKGTGLGLSQVYGFARSSGGEARIDSEVGVGTTVALYLPRSRKTPAPRALEPRAIPSGEGRILLVEDDPGVAAMVADMLRTLGYEVQHESGAAPALEAISRGDVVDLVFSDMVMPGGMDGMDLAREIARIRPELPVLLTTGFSPAAAAAEREGRRVLAKPYTIETLSETVARAFGGRGR